MKVLRRKKGSNVHYKYIENVLIDELRIICVGHEHCTAIKNVEGPMIKNRYIIHFCVKGKGYYNLNGKVYEICTGDVFFIPVNNVISYYPDKNDPWEYYWFEYSGQVANKLSERALLSEKDPVYTVKKPHVIQNIFSSMLSRLNDKTDDLLVSSYIYQIFSEIIVERSPKLTSVKSVKEEQLKKIYDYIHANYSDTSLCLTEIAKHVNMNPSYLSRFFRKMTNVPISKYIIELRIQKATILLKRKDLSVKSIAISVGYNDPLYFTREFRRIYHNTPTNYRKELLLRETPSTKKHNDTKTDN